MVVIYVLYSLFRWKVIDSDSSIQKSALFTKLKSGYPVRLICVKKEDLNKKTMWGFLRLYFKIQGWPF